MFKQNWPLPLLIDTKLFNFFPHIQLGLSQLRVQYNIIQLQENMNFKMLFNSPLVIQFSSLNQCWGYY